MKYPVYGVYVVSIGVREEWFRGQGIPTEGETESN